jgi:hypothetical protein
MYRYKAAAQRFSSTPNSPAIDTQAVLAQPGSRRVSIVRVQFFVMISFIAPGYLFHYTFIRVESST